MSITVAIGLWFLSGIVSVIIICLFDYFIYRKDVKIDVADLCPLVVFIAMGPGALILGICQLISHLTEKYQHVNILEIKAKRKED